ncbi:MAG TPA: GNAT family N-acetyltransferase [Gaiellaceae bacterium]|nr:GNAT family N-acetyltransferase [Gaiellaceae bacterium]
MRAALRASSVAGSLRSFRRDDVPAVLDLSRRALTRAEEHVGNPLWATRDELESELSDWDQPPEETLLVDEEDRTVAGFGGVEVARGFRHADLFGPLIAPGFRGKRLGGELLDASIAIALEHGRRTVVAQVGPRNISGRMLLEHAGFHPRGPTRAVFRLAPEEHRLVDDGPPGVEIRRGGEDDYEEALRLYRETFPEGVFPDEAWREGLEKGSVYLAERGGAPLALLNIDASDRWAYQIGVAAEERSQGVARWLLSQALQEYWREHPGETLGLSVEADNLPALRLLRRQGFAPLLVLQSYELWL